MDMKVADDTGFLIEKCFMKTCKTKVTLFQQFLSAVTFAPVTCVFESRTKFSKIEKMFYYCRQKHTKNGTDNNQRQLKLINVSSLCRFIKNP